jgi:phenylacetate-CoA ligase
MYLTGLLTYRRLMRNLKRPPADLKKEQWDAFRDLVRFAYENVPFYRWHYDRAGFHPRDLKSPEDIHRVPPTRKALFQQTDPQECIATGYRLDRLVRKRTSGSTGSPLNVYYTPGDRIYRTILHLRILFFNGMSLRDRMAHISDSRDVPDYRYGFQKLGFLPKEFVYAADSAAQQLENLRKIDPAVVYSYASSMVLLASEIMHTGDGPIRPKLIFTTGELLNPADRKLINDAFSVQLRDIYGIVEMGDVAWQCPALQGYHLNVDAFLAEVLKNGNPVFPGEEGYLTITNLHSRAMPIIRYEVGDVIAAPNEEPCSCGCTFPRIDVLQGRADDWLYTPDGKRISPLIFVVASIPGVLQYRMIQKTYDRLIVEILPGPGYSDETLKKTAEHVIEVMGPGVNVEVVEVDEIPRQSGKMRRVISEIDIAE